MARPTADKDNDRRCGFEFITARDLDRLGTGGVIERLKARVGSDANVYLSVDIDVLDPAYAPGKLSSSSETKLPDPLLRRHGMQQRVRQSPAAGRLGNC